LEPARFWKKVSGLSLSSARVAYLIIHDCELLLRLRLALSNGELSVLSVVAILECCGYVMGSK
jgi:hypothetical protein